MKPVDIVIPLGDGSTWMNYELKFSLRSIEKYLKNYRHIYLLTKRKPVYLNDKIIFIEYHEQDYHQKERRIMEKFKFACGIPEISDKFLMWNDDYILTETMDAENVKYYHKGDLLNSLLTFPDRNDYKQSLMNTYNALEKRNLPTKHFDIHFPIYYDKILFPQVMDNYDWDIKKGYVVKSLYCNSLFIKGEKVKDCKIYCKYTEHEIREAITGHQLFSTDEITRAMINYLAKEFPRSSSFEITT